MQKLKAIFFCGHESRYGLAHLERLLTSDLFDILTVVLAPIQRWDVFRSALFGKRYQSNFFRKLFFYQRLFNIKKRIRNLSTSTYSMIFDVNSSVNDFSSADILISAAYPQIFSSKLLDITPMGAINFHPSFLPRCRGAHPVYWTIASQEPFGGVSCHFMSTEIDEGPLLEQRKICFDPQTITYLELYSQIERETPLLIKDIENFFHNKRNAFPQVGSASYYRNDRAIHRKVNFTSEAPERISSKIRAGGAFCFDSRGRCISFIPPVKIISDSKHITNGIESTLLDGTVVGEDRGALIIKCGNSFIVSNFLVRDHMGFRVEKKILKTVGVSNNLLYSPPRIGEVLT